MILAIFCPAPPLFVSTMMFSIWLAALFILTAISLICCTIKFISCWLATATSAMTLVKVFILLLISRALTNPSRIDRCTSGSPKTLFSASAIPSTFARTLDEAFINSSSPVPCSPSSLSPGWIYCPVIFTGGSTSTKRSPKIPSDPKEKTAPLGILISLLISATTSTLSPFTLTSLTVPTCTPAYLTTCPGISPPTCG